MKLTQLLLPFPKKKPKLVQMTFRFKKEHNMKINPIKFFRTVSNTDKPKPIPSVKPRFERVSTGKKLDRMA